MRRCAHSRIAHEANLLTAHDFFTSLNVNLCKMTKECCDTVIMRDLNCLPKTPVPASQSNFPLSCCDYWGSIISGDVDALMKIRQIGKRTQTRSKGRGDESFRWYQG